MTSRLHDFMTSRLSVAMMFAVVLAAVLSQTTMAVVSATSPERTVIVSAASSLADVLASLAREYEAATGQAVRLNLGGSNALARQIADGAPADLFISADDVQVARLAAAGRVQPGTVVDLLSNQLAVVVPGDAPALATVRDLLGPQIRRVAIGDPAGVPAGVYARQYLEAQGLWDAIQSRIVPTGTVRAALAAVESGGVDAAIVYRTDAAVAGGVRVAFEVPREQAPRIRYLAAVVRGARNADAALRFLAWLQEREAAETFRRAGFIFTGFRVDPPGLQGRGGALEPGATTRADLWRVCWFTLSVALAATLLMLPPGIVLAWVLARSRFTGKTLLETIVSMPLVMPPVATGLILLRLLGRRGPLGALLASGGVDVVFTWKAVVIAMAVMGLPLVVRTARVGFEQVTRRYEQIAESLGAGRARVFFTISLPLAQRNVLAGGLLGFSRALGEFGATIVVAGAIPGRTRTIAVAIFNYIETGRDTAAIALLVVSVIIAFAAVWASNLLVKGQA
jgi:molybdate transport system permease protein